MSEVGFELGAKGHVLTDIVPSSSYSSSYSQGRNAIQVNFSNTPRQNLIYTPTNPRYIMMSGDQPIQMLTVSLNNKKTWRNRVATKGIHTPKPVLCWEKGSSDIKKYKSMYAAAKAIGVSVGMVSIICGIKNNGCKHAISKIDGKRYGFKLQSSDENPKSCPSLGCT